MTDTLNDSEFRRYALLGAEARLLQIDKEAAQYLPGLPGASQAGRSAGHPEAHSGCGGGRSRAAAGRYVGSAAGSGSGAHEALLGPATQLRRDLHGGGVSHRHRVEHRRSLDVGRREKRKEPAGQDRRKQPRSPEDVGGRPQADLRCAEGALGKKTASQRLTGVRISSRSSPSFLFPIDYPTTPTVLE